MPTAPYPILVVDDDQDNCDLLAEALSNRGYLIKVVPSGELACQLAREQQFSLIISDIQMRPVSGIELLKWFRKRFPTLPVVLITAFGSAHIQRNVMDHGAFHYLSKPINLDELFVVVDRALRHEDDLQDCRYPFRNNS
jgi:DNA-binding NtrC family response regulator